MFDLLPANATPQERALEASTRRLAAVDPALRSVWNPDTCPPSILPWLAWAFSVDEWDQTWTDAQKRDVIKRSVSVHRYKGTVGAVKESINALGIGAVLLEWYKQIPAGDPYTFNLQLDAQQQPITMPTITRLLGIVANTKNLRSHLSSVTTGATTVEDLNLTCASMVGLEITVQPGD